MPIIKNPKAEKFMSVELLARTAVELVEFPNITFPVKLAVRKNNEVSRVKAEITARV